MARTPKEQPALDSKAWDAGYAVGYALAEKPDCPCPAGSNKAWSWEAGWTAGSTHRKKASKPGRNRNPKTLTVAEAKAFLKRHGGTGYGIRAKDLKVRSASAARRKRNPQTAAELYEKFHGKPATKVREVVELERHRAELADLGRLIELEVKNSAGKFVLPFAPGVRVTAAGDGRSLFLIGGDQAVEPKALGITADTRKDHIVLGECTRIVYHTSKAFHNFEPSDYEHKLGEESGVRPLLCFDGLNRLLYFVGGNYRVRPEGIVD